MEHKLSIREAQDLLQIGSFERSRPALIFNVP